MIFQILSLFITFLISYIIYIHKTNHRFYDMRGVKYLPGVPFFGNTFHSMLARRHISQDFDEVYKAFPDERYVGFMYGTRRVLLIRDLELIKLITVTNFDCFTDHKAFFNDETETAVRGSLFFSKGQRWRDQRKTLGSIYTPSKLKCMLNHMIDISNNVIDIIKGKPDDVDLDEVIHRYVMDVVISLVFGFEMNSIKNTEDQVYKMARTTFNFNFFQRVKWFITMNFSLFTKVLGVKVFYKNTVNYYRRLIFDTVKYRKKYNLYRPDMMQLILNDAKEYTDDDFIGQLFLFLSDGLDSVSSIIILCIHELALNPNIQEKLCEEIKRFHDENKTVNYDNIDTMKYLECVINETLRKWSPGLFMDRICTKSYELPPPHEGGKPYKVKPGEVVYSSINSIHWDQKYFSDPYTFDPERFSEENRDRIQSATFIPFGLGPRTCIGSRVAKLVCKVMIYHLVLHYKIIKNVRTANPIIMNTDSFYICSKTGTWVKMEER